MEKKSMNVALMALGIIVFGVWFFFYGLYVGKTEALEEFIECSGCAFAGDSTRTSGDTVVWRCSHNVINEENLREELEAREVDYPDIVVAQAIVETGNFTSGSCTEDNNLFGLRNSDLTYKKFPHWTQSVVKYKECAQSYTKKPATEQEYYEHLKRIGYAENPAYADVIRETVARMRSRGEEKK